MKRKLLTLALALGIVTANAQDPWELGERTKVTKKSDQASLESNEKLVFELTNPGWRMEGALPDQGVKSLFHKHSPDSNHARVPGDVFTDLWRLGRIEDMNIGTNGLKNKWVNDYEWWYFYEFDIPQNMEGKQVRIQFDGVDFACEVYLNGILLGEHEGMFSDFSFDITDIAKLTTPSEPSGNNYLAVKLLPAVRSISLSNGRKYRWHGDYNQNVVPTGIWQPVKLVATGESRITDLYINPVVESKGATVEVELEVTNDSSSAMSVEAQIDLTGENFLSKNYTATIKEELQPGVNIIKTSIKVPDAQLWWPWDLGDQNLYTAKAIVKNSGGETQDVESTTFGIRKVEMKMNEGWKASEVALPWTVMINDQRHFVRSGTWGGPPDMFTGRTTEETYRKLIRMAKEANLNNLRIFNWHPVEIPLFYKLCNEEGITVWQDMGMMNNIILDDADLKKAAFDEVVCALKQRRNHPCNIIIEGSEEILFVKSASQRQFHWDFVTELGDTLRKYTNLHYVPTSPLGGHHGEYISETARHDSGHTHAVHYSVGKMFMEDYYPSQNFAVIPELAVTSCPDVESIRKFIPENELWPPKPSWGYHWADLDVLQAHNYEVFGEDFTDSTIEAFVEATQVAQGVYFQYSLEHYRTRKPKMSAVCFCHFILNSPDFKWATVDYYTRPKESHYYVQKAYQPLLVTLQHYRRRWMPDEQFSGELWVVNDYMRDYSGCEVSMRVLDNNKDFVERINYKIGSVAKDSSKKFNDVMFDVPGKMGDKFYVEVELKDANGSVISKNDYMFLVDDQEAALAVYNKYGEKSNERKAKYGSATNRYFPGLFDNTKGLEVEWLDVK